MKNVVLASQSPWRKKLLSWIGVEFDVVVSEFDEKSVEENDPKELVKMLAEKKAEVVEKLDGGVVIGADTVIVIDDVLYGDLRVLGKPEDIDHAREILSSLRGKEHMVYTGVCVMDAESGEKITEVDETRMVFADFSDEVLEEYLATGDSMGKAGAYQFLKIVDSFVEEFEGSVSGVIGLPIKRLVRMLKEVGVEVSTNTEMVMLENIGYKD